jgi:hypothetical protein
VQGLRYERGAASPSSPLQRSPTSTKTCEQSLRDARAERPEGKVVVLSEARLQRDASALAASWSHLLGLGLGEAYHTGFTIPWEKRLAA